MEIWQLALIDTARNDVKTFRLWSSMALLIILLKQMPTCEHEQDMPGTDLLFAHDHSGA